MTDYKLYIIVRIDREFSRGKLMVHVGHICTNFTWYNRDKVEFLNWKKNNQVKIILKGKDVAYFYELIDECIERKIIFEMVLDKGFYEVEPNTEIVLGIFCTEAQAKELGLKRLSLFK